jgi:hypothetical protein
MPISTINNKSIADGTVIAADILDGTISSSKLVSANIAGDRIAANTLSNTVFQTGSVESYMRAQGSSVFAGMRNRIINGAMVIDQRNSGSAVTPSDASYTLDRWRTGASQSAKLTIQQDSSYNTVAGFASSLKVTSLCSYSVGASDYFGVYQFIEGFNTADLRFGTANAKTITLSFWVRSSLTGTFGGAIQNAAQTRSYPFSYTIVAADTWEQKIITIPGDTSGTWVGATNARSLFLMYGLGIGSTYGNGTAGAWVGSDLESVTGAVSIVGTNGATWYLTGVQLEAGSTPTPFEYRQYGTELALCQRYFQSYSRYEEWAQANINTSTTGNASILFIQPMRASPTITLAVAGTSTNNISFLTYSGGSPATVGTHSAISITPNGFSITASGYTATGWAAGIATAIYAYTNPTTVYTANAEL